jgi:hypothetical protein
MLLLSLCIREAKIWKRVVPVEAGSSLNLSGDLLPVKYKE